MDSKTIRKHLKSLVEGTERELVNCMVQAWLFEREVANPINIGKEQAQKNLEVYQKRIKSLEQFINLYQEYAEREGFES